MTTQFQFMTPPPNPRAFKFLIYDKSITWGLENVYGNLETSQTLIITCLPETIDMLKHIRSIYTLTNPDASRVIDTIKYINNVFVNIKHSLVDGTVKELRIENNLLRNELQKLEKSAKIKEKEFKETIQKLEESAKIKEKEFKETIQKLEESAKNKEIEFKETIQKLEETTKIKDAEIKELNNDLIYFVKDVNNIPKYKKFLCEKFKFSYKYLLYCYNSLVYKTHDYAYSDISDFIKNKNDITYSDISDFIESKNGINNGINRIEYNDVKYMELKGTLFNLTNVSLNSLSIDDILGFKMIYNDNDSNKDGDDEDEESTYHNEYFLTPKGSAYHIDYIIKNNFM